MPDCGAASLRPPREHIECRVIAAIFGQRMIVAAEFAREVAEQRQMMPAALALEGNQPRPELPLAARKATSLLQLRRRRAIKYIAPGTFEQIKRVGFDRERPTLARQLRDPLDPRK